MHEQRVDHPEDRDLPARFSHWCSLSFGLRQDRPRVSNQEGENRRIMHIV